ncbi:MAG: DUF5335 family protein [Armatimonadota bacterium]
MSTQQIPQDKWNDYLSSFTAMNQTRNVVIDIESSELGSQRLVDGKPLLTVEPDLGSGRKPVIIVIAGDTQGDSPESLTHEVAQPKSIWVKENDAGQVDALDIETEDGRTIIQFV